MTYDNSHGDRRRYGRREDEPCGSWRTHRTVARYAGTRRTCTRRYHIGDPLHYTADRQWWWTAADPHPRPTATDPPPKNVTPAADTSPHTANLTGPANPPTEDTMTPTATIAFDKGIYQPGDTITAVVTLRASDPLALTRTLTGTLTLDDGTTVTFTGTYSVDPPIPTIERLDVTGGGGYNWTISSISSNTATLRTVA